MRDLMRVGVPFDPAISDDFKCHLVWWPDELEPPQFGGRVGRRRYLVSKWHVPCEDDATD